MTHPYALGYLLIESPPDAVSAWENFGNSVLGMSPDSSYGDGVLRFRMDERVARVILVPSEQSSFTLGWEYPSEAQWRSAVSRLEGAGVKLEPVDKDGLRLRAVSGACRFVDPAGVSCEVFYGGWIEPVIPFVSPIGVDFVTGDQGMGHVTLVIGNAEEAIQFYQDVLGMSIRETTFQGLCFLGVNARQHSLGIAGVLPKDAPPILMHLMMEVSDLDDVGRAQDKCLEGDAPLSYTLGKHWNDHMVSFYVKTPSGWDIEYGAGGLRVDSADEWTQVHQGGVAGGSVWGHRVVKADGTLGPNIGKQFS